MERDRQWAFAPRTEERIYQQSLDGYLDEAEKDYEYIVRSVNDANDLQYIVNVFNDMGYSYLNHTAMLLHGSRHPFIYTVVFKRNGGI